MGRLIIVKAPRGESIATVAARKALPGELVEFAELTSPGDELVIKFHREPDAVLEVLDPPVAVEADHPIADMTAKEAKAWVGDVPEDAVDVLADALAAERDGKKRKSVVAAIEARLDELTGGD